MKFMGNSHGKPGTGQYYWATSRLKGQRYYTFCAVFIYYTDRDSKYIGIHYYISLQRRICFNFIHFG
jgi:hypothetical protein